MAQNVDVTKMKQMVIKYAEKYKVPVDLALALVYQESRFNPRAKSKVGAMGLGQLMPDTAKSLGVKDPYDPEQNLNGAMKHLGNLIIHYKGNTDLALAAYNAGMGAVQKYGGIPPYKETQNYVKSINSGRKQYKTIASNSEQIPATIHEVMREKYRSGNDMSSQNGLRVDSIPQYLTPEQQQQMISGATQRISDFQVALNAMRAGQKTFEDLAAQFPTEVQQYGITKQMQGSAMTPVQEQLINRDMGLTPEQLAQIQANDQSMRQQMIDAQTNYNQGLAQQMQGMYDRQMELAQNNPLLQETGYYVNPRDIRSNQAAQIANQIGGFGMTLPTAEQLATQRYQAEVANKYGIPYEQLIQGKQEVYKNQLAILQQQASDLKELANQGQISQRTLMTELAKVNNTSAAIVESMKQNTEYAKAVAPHIIDRAGEIVTENIKNQGGQNQTSTTAAGNLAQENIKAQAGNVNATINADATMGAAGLYSDATKYASDIRQDIANADRPIKQQTANAYQFGQQVAPILQLPQISPRPYLKLSGYSDSQIDTILGTPAAPSMDYSNAGGLFGGFRLPVQQNQLPPQLGTQNDLE